MTKVVFGMCPMATKTPVHVEHPVFTGHGVLRRQSGDLLVAEDLGHLRVPREADLLVGEARSCMILDARRASRRCTTVTLEAKRVRNNASFHRRVSAAHHAMS